MAKDFAEMVSQPEPVREERSIQEAVIAHAQNDLSAMPEAPGLESKPKEAEPVVEQETSKLGDGHFTAMLRLGGHEITQALQAFPDSNIRPMEEPGVFGNENIPQKVAPQNEATQNVTPVNENEAPQNAEPVKEPETKEISFKDIVNAPAPEAPQVEQEMGGMER